MTHRKSDHNQAQIVQALRDAGLSVAVLSSLGGGTPDLLVSNGSVNLLVEIKNLDGRGKALTDAEFRFISAWRGPLIVATSAEDVLHALEWEIQQDGKTQNHDHKHFPE